MLKKNTSKEFSKEFTGGHGKKHDARLSSSCEFNELDQAQREI